MVPCATSDEDSRLSSVQRAALLRPLIEKLSRSRRLGGGKSVVSGRGCAQALPGRALPHCFMCRRYFIIATVPTGVSVDRDGFSCVEEHATHAGEAELVGQDHGLRKLI